MLGVGKGVRRHRVGDVIVHFGCPRVEDPHGGLPTLGPGREAAARLHLPFLLLSDEELRLASAMRLPTFRTAGMTLLKRFTLVIDDGTVTHIFYPVFPPDQSAADVIAWLIAAGQTSPP